MKAIWYEVLTNSVTDSNRDFIPGFNNPIFVKCIVSKTIIFQENVIVMHLSRYLIRLLSLVSK